MDFLLCRGQKFSESFDFKNEEGRPISLPRARYRIVLERGPFGREYTEGDGLSLTGNSVKWNISQEEVDSFAYNTLYYTLYVDQMELARGVLKVQ